MSKQSVEFRVINVQRISEIGYDPFQNYTVLFIMIL